MIRLDDRAIVVTGGSSGIGLATVRLALELGARVTIADIAPPEPDEAAAFVECDACEPEQVEPLLANADGLVTTVGGARLGGIEDLTLDGWNEQLRFNLTSAYVPCRAALRAMRERGGGSIVTVSSGYAYLPGPDRAAYCAAKAGVIAFTRALAASGAAAGVRANCIAPGPTDTPRFRELNDSVEGVRRQMPLGRIPDPIDCANMACYLLSDAARNVTGQVLHVNGGLYMAP